MDETLSVLCTLYRNKKEGRLDAKDAKLRLVSVGEKDPQSSERKAYAKAHFNVVDFMGDLGSGITHKYVFRLSRGIKVHAQVRLTWLDAGKCGGDGSSSYAASELSEMSNDSILWSDSDSNDDESASPTVPAPSFAPSCSEPFANEPELIADEISETKTGMVRNADMDSLVAQLSKEKDKYREP